MATTQYYKHISGEEDTEKDFDWKVGPCADMTWQEWVAAQGDIDTQNEITAEHDEADHDEAEHDEADDGNIEENKQDDEQVCPPTPRASASRSIRRQLFKSPIKDKSQRSAATIVEEIPQIEKPAYKIPKKAKTRAEKRAEDTSDIEDDGGNSGNSDFVTPIKRERRTDHWAFQDDLRLKRARAFKESREILGEVA